MISYLHLELIPNFVNFSRKKIFHLWNFSYNCSLLKNIFCSRQNINFFIIPFIFPSWITVFGVKVNFSFFFADLFNILFLFQIATVIFSKKFSSFSFHTSQTKINFKIFVLRLHLILKTLQRSRWRPFRLKASKNIFSDLQNFWKWVLWRRLRLTHYISK